MIRTYQDILAQLNRTTDGEMNPSLENIAALCNALGSPQNKFASIQVVGSNGKTSTSRMIDSILRGQGQSCGLTTSPALLEVFERIVLDGSSIDEATFSAVLNEVLDARDNCAKSSKQGTHDISRGANNAGIGNFSLESNSEGNTDATRIANASGFELLTAAAFLAFEHHGVDFGVIEAGIGGTWDATCIVNPAVAVITGVSLEHTKILGGTLEEIARDKAGVIKPGVSVILGDFSIGHPGAVIRNPDYEHHFPEEVRYLADDAEDTFGGDAQTILCDVFLAKCAAAGIHPRVVRAVGDSTPVSEDLTVRYKIHSDAQPTDQSSVAYQNESVENSEKEYSTKPISSNELIPITHSQNNFLMTRSIGTEFSVTTPHGLYENLCIAGPAYQAANCATAIAVAEAALGRGLDADELAKSVSQIMIPGRFEVLAHNNDGSPALIFDSAHNPEAARLLADTVSELIKQGVLTSKPTIVFGCFDDKDAARMIRHLAPIADKFILVEPDSPRALPLVQLQEIVSDNCDIRSTVCQDFEALKRILKDAVTSTILVTGSLSLYAKSKQLCR